MRVWRVKSLRRVKVLLHNSQVCELVEGLPGVGAWFASSSACASSVAGGTASCADDGRGKSKNGRDESSVFVKSVGKGGVCSVCRSRSDNWFKMSSKSWNCSGPRMGLLDTWVVGGVACLLVSSWYSSSPSPSFSPFSL